MSALRDELAALPHHARVAARVATTRPVVFSRSAPVELHTLVSHNHVGLYLVALTTLARHWRDVRIVAHDDGTLRTRDLVRLRRHVPTIDVVRRSEADQAVEPLLADHPTVAAVRRSNPRILQLVDYHVLAAADQVIGMDSDVVFLRCPVEVVSWANGDVGADFLYSPEQGWEPKGVHWLPDALPETPFVPDICCGFVCARRGFLSLDLLEELMGRTPSDILFHGRYVTQMYYSLLAGRLDAARRSSLGERYRSGRLRWLPDIDDRVLCHYFASHEGRSPRRAVADEREAIWQGLRG